jgi:alkylhydroperoxidase family enzyme
MQPDDVQPRIPPVAPPYSPEIETALRGMMPRRSPVEPLKLFRVLVRHPALAAAMTALGRFVLGRELALALRDREIVIHRVCARCGCEYEWGVHAASFGALAGLSPEELAATVAAGPKAPVWSERDALLLRAVDELHDTGTVSATLWEALAHHWTETQRLELLLIAGWYHAIAFIANGAAVEREEWAARFPAAAR